tara:strand:- start:1024 stop:2067 length:1044 start_codon:yes stop_codon:yes gene_type:complete
MTAGSGAPGTSPGPGGGAAAGIGTGGYGGSVAPSGYGQNPGPFGITPMSVQQSGHSTSALGPSAMGVGPAPSSNVSSTPVQNANQNAQNANALSPTYALGDGVGPVPSVLGATTAQSGHLGFQVPPANTVTSSTLGVPATNSEGIPVTHSNLSGEVAGTAILPSDIANAKFFNNAAEVANPLGDGLPGIMPMPPSITSVPAAMIAFFAQMAQAQTPQNVANTRAALALSPPSQSPFGGTTDFNYSHPMGLSRTSRPNTPSYGTVNRAEPAREQLAQAIASASPRDPDPVTGIAPLPTPVATGVVDTIFQNALAKLQPTRQVQGVTSNRVFNPQIQKIIQQFRDQALA